MHTALTIRRADCADLAALTELERALFGGFSYPYSVLRQIVDTVGSGLRVAVGDGDTVVGYSLTVAAEEPLVAWLWSMGVAPGSQRQGIGRRLVGDVLDAQRAAGVKRVLLTVDPANTVAVALYKAFDFGVVSLVNDYFGPGEDRLVLERHC